MQLLLGGVTLIKICNKRNKYQLLLKQGDSDKNI